MTNASEQGKIETTGYAQMLPNFEERAAAAGMAGLNTALERMYHAENRLDGAGEANMWLALAEPYAELLQGSTSQEAAQVAFNALYFGMAVGSHILGRRQHPHYPFDRTQPANVVKERLLRLKETYFENRPTIQSWVQQCTSQLDPSGNYSELVGTIVAVTLSDFEQKEQFDLGSRNPAVPPEQTSTER